ncbi:MAG: hypothetical protein QF726_04560, partial [Alphaproteobacteria bacterium]|nr:hypothetical protein [Alphaproteobacteria bacterium]
LLAMLSLGSLPTDSMLLGPGLAVPSSLSLGVLDRETGERDVISLPAPVQGAIQLRLATSAPLFALLRRADTLLTLESD